MGGKSKAPKPDPNIGIAQQQMADIARQQLEFARESYYAEQPRLDRYADLADQFVRIQQQAQSEQSQLTQDYAQRMKGTFYPIEDTLAFDALGYYDASPEVQAKIEQAYLKQNQGLVDQRYQDAVAQEKLANQQRMQSFEKQTAEIGQLTPGLKLETQSKGPNGVFRAKGADGKPLYTAKDIETVGGSIDQSIAANQANIRSMENQIAGFKPDSQQYRMLAARLSDAKDQQAKLEAYKSSFADYLTVDKDTGMTLAEKAAQQRLEGLKTGYEQDKSNVGSTLDTVRAYSEAYKSGQEQQAGMARQDVAQQFDQRGLQLQRQLASFGVDPTSGRFAAQMNSNNIMQAAAEAQAMNQARNAAKQLGWAKRMDAAGLGRGLPGSQATSAGLAQSLGQGALSGQGSISGMNQQANSAFMSGLGAAGNSFGNLGNLSMQVYQQKSANVNAANAAKAEMTGALLGAAGGIGAAAI